MAVEQKPEWRIPPPPFRGPHTEASKIKNRLSNIGKKRSPDFGPMISAIMVDVWKREEYRKKREGKKRGKPSAKTRRKMAKSLERRWRHDAEYRRLMEKARRAPEWRTRSRQTLTQTWKTSRDRMLEHARNAVKKGKLRKDVHPSNDGYSEKDYWRAAWVDFKNTEAVSRLFNVAEIQLMNAYFEGGKKKTKSMTILLNEFTLAYVRLN